jgi:hypothetical protein
VQAQIGVCFEIANLYEQMTGIENLKLFAQLFSVKNFHEKSGDRPVRSGFRFHVPGDPTVGGNDIPYVLYD